MKEGEEETMRLGPPGLLLPPLGEGEELPDEPRGSYMLLLPLSDGGKAQWQREKGNSR